MTAPAIHHVLPHPVNPSWYAVDLAVVSAGYAAAEGWFNLPNVIAVLTVIYLTVQITLGLRNWYDLYKKK